VVAIAPYRIDGRFVVPHLTPTTVRGNDVVLRPWSEDDFDALLRRINDPAIAAFLDRIPQPYTEEDARTWFAISADGWRDGTAATFGIHVDNVDGVVGGIGIRFLDDLDEGGAEIGYWVGAELRGRGVATSATRAAAEWAFATVPDLARLQLRADVENVASNRVAEKSGFTREGVLRAQRYNERLGRRVDFVMWSLLREEV
jgi:RimJ/RimL family protein N-acetyltransferase